jgi:cysteine desulfurase family protein (TIGR01976 family)
MAGVTTPFGAGPASGGTQTTAAGFDVEAVRSHFPALTRQVNGRPMAYLDGPAGTQVPRECIEAIDAYLETSNANNHGAFAASHETDELLSEVHAAAADFVGASDPGEIAFGPNMTTLTFAVSRAIGRTLRPEDEIVVTRLDHDANVAPWLALQEERGVIIRWVGINQEDCTLDLAELERAVGPRTRVVAVGLASNAVGTINPVARIAEQAHAVGARLWIDAVHAGPHLPIDVAELGADYLVCSAYKFYGPHLGVLWGRRELLEALPAYKVRPAGDELPSRFETGTQSHEALAGLLGTFRYLEWLGVAAGAAGEPGAADGGRASRLRAAMTASRAYERDRAIELLAKVGAVPGVRIRGITDPARVDERCPTIAFTVDGHSPRDVAAFVGDRAISVWDGDYYAYELIRTLGLAESRGMVRVGLVNYNTSAEIDRLVDALHELAGLR